jgi:ankyrin repeat protein
VRGSPPNHSMQRMRASRSVCLQFPRAAGLALTADAERYGHVMPMYNVHTFFGRLWQSPILRRAAVLLVALGWSSFAFGGETNDAAQSRYVKQAKTSLERNPDWAFSKDTAGLTPLHRAALRGHKDVAEFLLAHKADVNAKDDFGATPLLCAALRGYTDVVELLLANKADVNAKDKNGLTPLHCAAAIGDKAAVELLLVNMADVNAKAAREVGTPLHCAVLGGNKDVAELLLANKAEVNAKNDYGMTPLHVAAQGGAWRGAGERLKAVAELLLANKAEVNVQDNYGQTPLHLAAMDGHKGMVELLLANKAEVNAKNNEGQTPLQIAAHHKSKDVVELLRQHGGHE